MRVKISGIVKLGDGYRVSEYDRHGSVYIGNVDLVKKMESYKGKFTFGIADSSFTGEVFVDVGWGYSEWTPMDSDTLKVGDHDLIKILSIYDEQKITLFISNEESNILDDSEWEDISDPVDK